MQNGPLVDVKLRVSDAIVRGVAAAYFEGAAPEPQTLLALDFSARTISIFPQIAYFSDRLYQQKYNQIREIMLDFGDDLAVPKDHFGALEALKELPSGFIEDPAYGLGLTKEMRPLVNAIERIPAVTRLVIGESETTRLDANTFYMAGAEFRLLRYGISRVTRRYQAESLMDRQIMAHNASVHVVRPKEFPLKERPYEPGMIYKLLGGSQSGDIKLRGKDRTGVLAALATNAAAIAERDPKEFVQLQKDIELVSLDRLIVEFQARLRKGGSESEWQRLLELNPFLLTMLFGQPIVVLRAGASVGGQTIAGNGTKIADFLGENPISHNAVLVELKKPATPLLGSKYGGGVYGPSAPLMSSIVQVLDQRLKLTTDIAGIKHKSKSLSELQVYSVECVVVAGRTPKSDVECSSFELIRSQLKDVRVFTFDELLERLQLLRELLSGERYVSDLEDDDFGMYSLDGADEEYGDETDEDVFYEEDRDPRD